MATFVGMLGISALTIAMMLGLFALAGLALDQVGASPVAISGIVAMVTLECGVLWLASRD